MKDRNSQLRTAIGGMATKERIIESNSLPKEDTRNHQGHAAYSIADELRLIGMLNTLKVEPQFYRSENETMKELRDLVERIGMKNPYFLAQAIVYSRCMGEGMRSINHLAATFAAPFVSGTPWAKAFYGAFNKREKNGGVVYRLDDMTEIKDVWAALNTINVDGKSKMLALPNAMKKGFASVLENADANLLAKYKSTVIDIANLVHPRSKVSTATVVVDGKEMKVLDALMKGITVTADTWESNNSEAGQIVAEAVRQGKMSKSEADKVLAEAKNDNWESLLNDGKLGVLAALRNIRNIMKDPRKSVIDAWCKLITDDGKIRNSLIQPMQIDLAYETVMSEFSQADYSPKVQQALLDAYEKAIPNLAATLPGRTCVIIDCSGSMGCSAMMGNTRLDSRGNGWYGCARKTASCSYKAGLIAATIAKATGADVIKFGTAAQYVSVARNKNVFSLASELGTADYGGTNPATAFELMTRSRKAYDRIIFISDNEVNGRLTSSAYSKYIHDVCSPYVYGIDLAAYGTTPLKNPGKVNYYYGYGFAMFEDIAKNEFNPQAHIDKVRAVVIDPNYTPTEQDLDVHIK